MLFFYTFLKMDTHFKGVLPVLGNVAPPGHFWGMPHLEEQLSNNKVEGGSSWRTTRAGKWWERKLMAKNRGYKEVTMLGKTVIFLCIAWKVKASLILQKSFQNLGLIKHHEYKFHTKICKKENNAAFSTQNFFSRKEG